MNHKKRGFKQKPSSKNAPWRKRLWRWTGWSDKRLWDWQAILFIPVSGALIVSLFALWQNDRQRELETLRAERATVESYLEHIGKLLRKDDLRTAGEDSDVRLLARARTLAALDGVSGHRKVRLLEFLYETQLIQSCTHGEETKQMQSCTHGEEAELIQRSSQGEPPIIEPPIISLRFANLSDTSLVSRHILKNTDLDRADLSNANLSRANLSGATLSKADLSGAALSNANLENAKGVSCQQAEDVESLENATMPNGQEYQDWPFNLFCGWQNQPEGEP
jgi:hypothetical protein